MFLLMGAISFLSTPALAEVLSWQGLGAVQLGMTVKAAERALGKKLAPPSDVYISDKCYETWRLDKVDPGIGYVVENGKITVIQVYISDGQTSEVTDKNHVGIGATEESIRQAYGQIKKGLGFYDRGELEGNLSNRQQREDTGKSATDYVPEFLIEAESPYNKRTITFTTKAGKITSMATGFKPTILDPEPCI